VCVCVIWMLGFWKGLRAVSSLVCYRNCLPSYIVVFCYIVQPVSNYSKLCNRYICTCKCINCRACICSFPQAHPLKLCAVPSSFSRRTFWLLIHELLGLNLGPVDIVLAKRWNWCFQMAPSRSHVFRCTFYYYVFSVRLSMVR